MQDLSPLFKEYCKTNITDKAKPLSEQAKQKIISNLRGSFFKSVVQAWTVLDLFEYKHLWLEGFDTYFGYQDNHLVSANMLDLVHPEDREAYGQLCHLALKGLLNMRAPVKNIGHFCISYRIRMSCGEYVKILETSNIIESDEENNIPLINLSQISRIEGMQKSNQVTYYFLMQDDLESTRIMESYLNRYNCKPNFFNQTEIKIAQLLKTGLTSKVIADHLCLSKHTIDKYRKNLLEKTQSVNTPQLLAYLTEINIL